MRHLRPLTLTFLCAAVPLLRAATLPQLLNLSSTTVEFSPTVVGTLVTDNGALTVSNPGSSSVLINSLTVSGANASDFTAAAGTCPLSPSTLAPGQYCYLNFTFKPAALGVRSARLILSVANGAPQTALLTGSGAPSQRVISLSPPEASFSATPLGLPQQRAPGAYITLNSVGDAPVTISSVSLAGAGAANFAIYQDNCTGQTLTPPASCQIIVTFVPTATGFLTAGLHIVDNAGAGSQTVPLAGIGTPAENQLTVSTLSADFADISTGGYSQLQIGLNNTGTENVTINTPQITGLSAADFSLPQNTCAPTPYALTPGNTCSMTVQFSPSALGLRMATLTIPNSSASGNATVPLQGVGVAPSLNISAGSYLNFGPVTIDQPFTTSSWSISNEGTAPVNLTITPTGTDAAEFTVKPSTCALAPHLFCTPLVTVTPAAAGIRSALLTMTDSITGLSESIPVVADGQQGAVALTAQTPAFVDEPIGTPSPLANLSITNYGSSAVSLGATTLGGPNAGDFTVFSTQCVPGQTLNPNQSCSISLGFTPSALGSRIALLDLSFNGTQTFEMPLVAQGVTKSSQISFLLGDLNFVPQAVGVPTSASATLQNSGNAPAKITSVSVTGSAASDYAVIENQCPTSPATLPAGAQCQVTIQFQPTATGPRDAVLQVADNATGSPQLLPIYGIGGTFSAPSASLTMLAPFPLALEPVGSSEIANFSLYNVGSAPLAISSISVSGPNASDFSESNNCPTSLPVLSSCLIYVTFRPTVAGFRIAQLSVASNDPNGPAIATLAGIAVTPTASVAFAAGPVDFGQTAVSSPVSKNVQLTNTGVVDVLLNSFQIAGLNAHDFGLNGATCPIPPAPLHPGSNCYIDLSFSPAAAGVRLGVLKVSDNATGSPQAIPLVGAGVPGVAALELTLPSYTFGATPVGQTVYSPQFELRNAGTLPVNIGSLTFSGANPGDFNTSLGYCTGNAFPIIPANTYCTLSVTFTPTASGTRTATLTVTSNAANGPQTMQLSGTGQ